MSKLSTLREQKGNGNQSAYHEAQYSLSPPIFSSKQVDSVPRGRISILVCLTPEKSTASTLKYNSACRTTPFLYPRLDPVPTLVSHSSLASTTTYSFIPSTFPTLKLCLILKSNIISSDPPGIAYARTSLYSLSTLPPCPPLLYDSPPKI